MRRLTVLLALVVMWQENLAEQGDCAADICFAIDESGSVAQSLWNDTIEFMGKFVDELDIGVHHSQVGVVKFNYDPELSIKLNDYGDKGSLKAAIAALEFNGGSTYIAKAINMVREECFKKTNGDRPNGPFPNILILLSDGSTSNQTGALQEANQARLDGITIITIDINYSQYSTQVMKEIAGNIVGNYFIHDKSDEFVDAVHDQLCDTVLECVADICLLLDESGSITSANWLKIKAFLYKFVNMLTIGATSTRVSIWKFAEDTTTVLPLDATTNKADMLAIINNLSFGYGRDTRIDLGIRDARTWCFRKAAGDRFDGAYPNIMVLVTDGATADLEEAISEANQARQQGINLIVIGIGQYMNSDNLLDIAGGIEENFLTYEDSDAFVEELFDVYHMYCKEAKVTCSAEYLFNDLWDFDIERSDLPDEKVTLIEYNPGDGDIGCKFRLVWDRRTGPFPLKFMTMYVGVHPNNTVKFFRGIDFEQKPHIISDEPTQRGWKCKSKNTNNICLNPPFIPWYPYMIGMPPHPVSFPYAVVTLNDPGPVPLSYKVEEVIGEMWCPGPSNNPRYAVTYYFEGLYYDAKMVFELDKSFYQKHWNELTGACVGVEPDQ